QKKDILQVLGGVDDEQYQQFITMIQNNQTQNIIDFSKNLYNNGINFEVFLDGLTDYILSHLTRKSNPSYQKITLQIAKKASEIIKVIKYSDNPNIIFAIEFLSFSEDYSSQEPARTNETVEKKQEIIPDNSKATSVEKRKSLSPTPVVSQLSHQSLDKDLLNEIKTTDIDLYVALMHLKCEETSEAVIKIYKNNSYPLSNFIIEMKEKSLRDYFEKYSTKVEIIEDSKETLRQIKEEKRDNEEEKIPVEVKGIYDKLKKLFPESDIIIKDNQK
ncbi:MAG: hypothetical protein ACOC34_03135, partial [Thermotogota bacterium]